MSNYSSKAMVATMQQTYCKHQCIDISHKHMSLKIQDDLAGEMLHDLNTYYYTLK